VSDRTSRSSQPLNRRQFLSFAAALGAAAAWAGPSKNATSAPSERRDLYPEGVASGDPDSTSVLLCHGKGRRTRALSSRAPHAAMGSS
jgi:hypothetical protein